MLHRLRTRPYTTWLALWVLVLNALMPLAAQAMARAQGAPDWIEVCTSTGMVRVQADGEPLAQGDAPAGIFDMGQHCPACTLHPGVAGLPPTPLTLPVASAVLEKPPAYWQAPSASRIWLPAHSRAPPSLV